MDHLYKWHRAVGQQAERCLDLNRPNSSRQVDGYLFTQALRQALRAGEMVANSLPEGSARELARSAVDQFNRDCSTAKDVRDILDHFDDYARGIGNLAHPGIRLKDRQPTEEAAIMFEPEVEFGPSGEFRLHCGDRVVDVTVAAKASDDLFSTLHEAIGLIESSLEEALAATGPQNSSNPAFVGFAFWCALIGEKFTRKSIRELRKRVTPESRKAWSNFSEARKHVHGYAITTMPVLKAAGVVDMKLVPESDSVRMATTEVIFTGAQWMTLQRRPDIDGSWYVHSIGGRPTPPNELPPI
ncbi:hypothetical protein [Streptomyces sp. BH055]|uniref:hypothetical protein n=1 Tax=Streptomyces sp. BH055 TaxID=3401173 RepID=UPI003BB7D1FC